MRFLTESEIITYLWTGKNSVVNQALAALNEYHERLCRNEEAFKLASKGCRDNTADM